MKFNKILFTTSFVLALSASAMYANAVEQQQSFYPEKAYIDYALNRNYTEEVSVDANGVAHIQLWSPRAESVVFNIYEKSADKKPKKTFKLKLNKINGTWTVDITSKQSGLSKGKGASNVFEGKFYTFQVTQSGQKLEETPGIWAKAVGVNGNRGAFVDMSKTNPEGWNQDKNPFTGTQTDAIVYEMHHRDMTMHENSGIKNKGKFVAWLENGTLSVNGQKTGIDHLKELGITHVQILPSYDYSTVDETRLDEPQYNWGYDPKNYNAPEGSYSTNPYDPACRIKEMKQMIQALHKAGIAVVMDVVYNHTVDTNSNFNRVCPGYFYRHNIDGTYSDASGCGNETASDREMMSDYIVNSIAYWMTEYHINGFRFDLMGIHDINTMNRVAERMRQIDPHSILHGEGWTGGGSPLVANARALKDNAYRMPGVGVFSDDIRDAIKGHYSNAEDCGFATGKPGNEETVKLGICGATIHPQIDYTLCNNSKHAYAIYPAQSTNYVSCHDDMMLTDKLAKSMPNATLAERKRAAKLAETIVLTSQGMAFLWCGEEVYRDKKGVHNSFCSPDSINAIDWNLKKDNRDQFDYYAGLVALRKAHPAFRMTTSEDIIKHLRFDDNSNTTNLISYSLLDNANGDSSKEIKVIFNGSKEDKTVSIPEGNWTILAQDEQINVNGLGASTGGDIVVKATSATILVR